MNKIYKIGVPKSPCKKQNIEIVGPVSVVMMTCGGGMGGCQWKEYGSFVKEPEIGKMAKFISATTGEEITINPAYIVNIKTKKLVKVTSDTTLWRNYNKVECKKRIETHYFWFDESDTIETTPGYTSYIGTGDGQLGAHLIGEIVDETPCD